MGIPTGEILYKDLPRESGKNLFSQTLPLVGKPDYLIKVKEKIVPVEVKTGKTPSSPYISHVMQLIAYCYLVEENYHQSIEYGIVKYPNKHFLVKYSKGYKDSLIKLVEEIYRLKTNQKTLNFYQIKDQICKQCKKEI